MTIVIALIVLLLLLVVVFAAMYNGLVRLNQQANEAWSDITVQLKRRFDLIPNLVNTVKGYASHEKTVFEDVTKARANALSAQTPAAAGKAEGDFQQTMKSLFAVAEAYPDLKASQNFQQLQADLTDTEDKIQASRRFYNGVVRDLNIKMQVFPNSLFAKMLGFKQREFFDVDQSQTADVQNPVDVKF